MSMFFFDNHDKLVKNSRFLVFIGILKMSFAKVSGLEQEIEKEFFVEGGNNSYGILSVMPRRERNVLRFERGVQAANPAILRMVPGVAIPAGITILMINDNNIPVHMYHASDVMITKWEVTDFDANNTNILIDTFEMSYSTIEKVSLQLF